MTSINILEQKINYYWLDKNIKSGTKYLIMNDNTLDIMASDEGKIVNKTEKKYLVPCYHGIPIATCNIIPEGVVEII